MKCTRQRCQLAVKIIDRQQAIDPICVPSMFDSLEVEVLYPA